MTPRPSADDVRDTIQALTDTFGRAPSVLAVATHFGLANTTFRRHYPDITADLITRRRTDTTTTTTTITADPGNGLARLRNENAALRSRNRQLSEDLELAIAHIQRLALGNHELRQQVEARTSIAQLRAAQRRKR